ncbi:MAG: hypothetical protein ACLPSM_01175 [Acidimicrobiales bacterium]
MALLQRAGSAGSPSPSLRAASGSNHKTLHYKWIALSNTTLGMLMPTINSSITLIALPDSRLMAEW